MVSFVWFIVSLLTPFSLKRFPTTGSIVLEDLWNGLPAEKVTAASLSSLVVRMEKDLTAKGGLAVLKISVQSGKGVEESKSGQPVDNRV